MKQVFVFIKFFVLTSMTAFAVAAERPAQYAYGLAIEASGAEALYDVTLPPSVYRGVTRRDLGDVRVFNGAGELVPHAWRPRRTETAEAGARVSLTLFALKAAADANLDNLSIRVQRAPGGAVSVDVQSGNANVQPAPLRTVGYLIDLNVLERPLREIEVDWKAAEGFSGKLRIDASDDLASWRTLVASAPLLSLTMGGASLSQKRVELPPHKAKYLRMAWVRDGDKSVVPEIIAVSGELADKFVEAPREWAKVNPGKSDKVGDYVFDLQGLFPADRLRLELPQVNTTVPVEVFTRDAADQPWRSIARSTVYRLRRGDGEIVSPDLKVNAAPARHWMIRVDQLGGGLGSGVPVLHVGWVPHQLVFAARGAPPFTLAYGSRGATSGAQSIESLIPGYREDAGTSVRAAKTGAQQTVNVQAASSQPQKELGGEARLQEQIDWKRWSLWGVLLLGVLVLGVMAWRLMKQLGSSTPGDKS